MNKFISTKIATGFDSYTGSIATTDLIVKVDGQGNIISKLSDVVDKSINLTYSELKELRDNSLLLPGLFYRITDYVTAVASSGGISSAEHPFDIIVRADNVNTINENAHAILHEGDNYFANSNLAAWELKYDIDVSVSKYNWGYERDSKGIIYYMKDEWGNECYYDFKNICFSVNTNTAGLIAGVQYYTFSCVSGTNDSTVSDHSLNGLYCYGNKIGTRKNSSGLSLPCNIFRNTSLNSLCYSNIIKNGSHDNIFGSDCYSNILGERCYLNTFGLGCHENILGNECYTNTISYRCSNNIFGNNCYNNIFGNSCDNNIFENNCNGNTLGSSCISNVFKNFSSANSLGNYCNNNIFENNCYNNTFGNNCSYNTLGTNCKYILFGNNNQANDYYLYITIESGNQYINLECSASRSNGDYCQYIKILQGYNNSNTVETITIDVMNNLYQIEYPKRYVYQHNISISGDATTKIYTTIVTQFNTSFDVSSLITYINGLSSPGGFTCSGTVRTNSSGIATGRTAARLIKGTADTFIGIMYHDTGDAGVVGPILYSAGSGANNISAVDDAVIPIQVN